MKFVVGILHEKSSSKCHNHANPHGDSCTLLKGVNEFILYFPYFLMNFVKFDIHIT